jgi:prepilin peptidase CpaA
MDTWMISLLTAVLATAMWTDLRSSRIPNWLTFSAAGIALAGHAWLGGLPEMALSMTGLVTGLGLFFLFYLSGGMGAADVKLMAAVGAFVGPYGALSSGVLALVVGGFYALAAMCYQWGVVGTAQRLALAGYGALVTGGKEWAQDIQLPFRLRYGLAIVAGTLLFLLGLSPFEG